MHTRQSCSAMHPFLERASICWTKFVYTIKMLLSFKWWTKRSSIPIIDVITCSPVVEELASLILKNLPRRSAADDDQIKHNERSSVRRKGPVRKRSSKVARRIGKMKSKPRGNNGWSLPKFHSIFYTGSDLQDFGSAQNKDGEAGEEGHKEMFKKKALRTSRVQL